MVENRLSEHGQVPPQAVELEEATLGALLQEKDAYDKVSTIINSDTFYKPAHGLIFEAIRSLQIKGEPSDILTVSEELKRLGNLEKAGGQFYVSQLTSKVANASHIENHARIIAQKFIQRELIRIGSEINNMGYDETSDVEDLLNESDRLMSSVRENVNTGDTAISFNKCLDSAYSAYAQKEINRIDGVSTGVPTGLPKLDKLLGGWQPSDLIVLAARPSMGKTAIALFFARIAAKSGHNTLFFSLEMGKDQLTNRMISSYDVDPSNLRDGNMSEDEKSKYSKFICDHQDIPLHIDDKAGATVSHISSTSRRLHKRKPLGLIVVDYIQLVNNSMPGRSRENEVSEMSRSLKILAKDLNVPIIALSQLSRQIEQRVGSDKIPKLSDLRESGAIEQDADIIIFPVRPWIYGITEDEDGNFISKGDGCLYVKKHRNGSLGDIKFSSNEYLSDFYDYGSAPFVVPDNEEYNPNKGIEPAKEFDSDDPF